LDFITQIKTGLSSYLEAHRFIRQHHFVSFFLMPIIFNFLMFMFFSGLVWHYAALAADYIYYSLNIDLHNFDLLHFIKPLLHITITIIFRLLGIFIYLLSFRYIILILMAPVLSIVSARVEEIVTGKEMPFEWLQFLKDTSRGIIIASRNSVMGIIYSVMIFFMSFIPLVGLASPVLLFLIESYYYGFSMLDYTLERHKMSISQSRQFIKQHKWLAIALGSVFNILVITSVSFSVFPSVFVSFLVKVFLMIPLLALSVAPIYGVVAGTLAMIKINPLKISSNVISS
jgi:CysZ protein